MEMTTPQENAPIETGNYNQTEYQHPSLMPPTTAPVMSVKDWIIASLITMIPIVGFVMIFIWAFGDGANPNKANWAKASLLLMLIVMAISIVFAIIFFAIFAGAAASGGYDGTY